LINEVERVLVCNVNLFTWRPDDMLGIDPDFRCHKLVILPQAKPMLKFFLYKILLVVVRHVFIRVFLVLVASMDMELEQLNVKVVFLHGNILMFKLEGFEEPMKENSILERGRLFYNLKQFLMVTT